MDQDFVKQLEQINRRIRDPSRESVQLKVLYRPSNFTSAELALELCILLHGIVEKPRADLQSIWLLILILNVWHERKGHGKTAVELRLEELLGHWKLMLNFH